MSTKTSTQSTFIHIGGRYSWEKKTKHM